MNKKIIAALLAAAILLLTGCQLAVPEAQTAAQPDSLVGVFITTEYLDLFDMNAFLEDNIDSVIGGDEIESNDAAKYEGRIYAELTEETYTDDGGEEHITHTYKFPDTDGMLLAYFEIQSPDHDSEPYRSLEADDTFSDIETSLNVLENGTSQTVYACIYLADDAGEVTLYYNPVYQTANGEVYLVSGGGMIVDPSMGISSSQTLADTCTYTENGEETAYTSECEVAVDCISPADTVVLLYMDEKNRELGRNEYDLDQLPEELTVVNGTSYILVEEHSADDTVRRSLIQPEDEFIELYRSAQLGICIKDQISVYWP